MKHVYWKTTVVMQTASSFFLFGLLSLERSCPLRDLQQFLVCVNNDEITIDVFS